MEILPLSLDRHSNTSVNSDAPYSTFIHLYTPISALNITLMHGVIHSCTFTWLCLQPPSFYFIYTPSCVFFAIFTHLLDTTPFTLMYHLASFIDLLKLSSENNLRSNCDACIFMSSSIVYKLRPTEAWLDGYFTES